MVITKKFGLVELERYATEVGFKNGDVRTIKGVLAIVGIPNAVVDEAQEAISTAKAKISSLFTLKDTLIKTDADDEVQTKNEIQKIRDARDVRKRTNQAQIKAASTSNKVEDGEIKRLEGILKKFS